jgi:hypothetical protein
MTTRARHAGEEILSANRARVEFKVAPPEFSRCYASALQTVSTIMQVTT